MLRVEHLSKSFTHWRPFARDKPVCKALDDVTLTLSENSTVAVVGESGAGKSTLCRCILRLIRQDSGEIRFEGGKLSGMTRSELGQYRRNVQLVFQDAASSMNGRFSAFEIVEEPLRIQTHVHKKERMRLALRRMEELGIPPQRARSSPLEFSGGERQRLALARALIVRPKLLLFDEALAGLDVILRAEITGLLLSLKRAHNLTYLHVTHDLGWAASVADEILVMYAGRIVEAGTPSDIFNCPQHPHTQQLLATMPQWR